MADSPISGLPAGTVANLTDLIAKVNDPSGTPETQKLTVALLIQYYTGVVAPVANPANVNAPATFLNTANGFYYTWNIPSAVWVVVPKVYRAILTMGAGATVTASVLENTLGTVTWSKGGLDNSVITAACPAAVTAAKTLVLAHVPLSNGESYGASVSAASVAIGLTSPQPTSDFAWSPIDWFGVAGVTFVQFLVYP